MATTRNAVPQEVLDKLEIRLHHIRQLPPLVPLVVSYGAGVNSTAMLVYMKSIGIAPDRIQMADTGDELPETYAYLPVINDWLRNVGFPQVTVVKKRSKHKSLFHNCIDNNTLPGLAFGYGTCALKWKVDPMRYDLNHWYRSKQCFKAGYKVVKAIGYDASGRDQQRFCDFFKEETKKRESGEEDNKYAYWYPLIEAGIDREACEEIVKYAGLPLPIKSACFFCPARKGMELVQLAEKHPDLARNAVLMEQVNEDGIHGIRGSTVGLGRKYKWADYLDSKGYNLRASPEEVEKILRRTGAWHRYGGVRRDRPECEAKRHAMPAGV